MTAERELLLRYARHHDEAAFADLVKRHADLVYSVALRVAANPQIAEDVTQEVFTKLARQAGALTGHPTLLGWLHTTARHTAINAIRGEIRRQHREQEALAMSHDTASSPPAWNEIRPLLDEAIGQLREGERQAVMLRYFSGLSHQEVGTILGLSENSANKRVERALEKLRGYFISRGVKASSALLAAAITTNSVQAAPAGLVEKVTPASLAAAGGASAGSALFLTLFMSTKAKLIVLAVIAIVAVVLTINWPKSAVSPESGSPASAFTPAKAAVALLVASPAPVTPSVNSAATTKPAVSASLAVSTQATTSAASAPAAASVTVGPKSDLNEAISAGIHFSETQDVRGLLQTLMPPMAAQAELGPGEQQLTDDAALDAFVAKVSQQPGTAAKLNNLLAALNAIQVQNLTPAINDAGTRATYTFDAPVGGHKVIIFNKLNGFWYLDGM